MEWDGETLHSGRGANGPVVHIPVGRVTFELDREGIGLADGSRVIPWADLLRLLAEPDAVRA
jgi:hypothetical protein